MVSVNSSSLFAVVTILPAIATISRIAWKRKDVGRYHMESLGLTPSHSLERCATKCIAAFQKYIKNSAIERWYTLRDELDVRQQSRRTQFHFRRNPDTYLETLEHKLLLLRLPP